MRRKQSEKFNKETETIKIKTNSKEEKHGSQTAK